MPGRLIMGVGALKELPGIIQQLGKTNPLIVTDTGIVKAGICERIKAVLENENIAEKKAATITSFLMMDFGEYVL